MGSVKLRTLVPVGGVSNSEIVRLAFPPPPQFVTQGPDFRPLHEVNIAIAEKENSPKYHFDFIGAPLTNFTFDNFGAKGWKFTLPHCNAAHFQQVSTNAMCVQLLTVVLPD